MHAHTVAFHAIFHSCFLGTLKGNAEPKATETSKKNLY